MLSFHFRTLNFCFHHKIRQVSIWASRSPWKCINVSERSRPHEDFHSTHWHEKVLMTNTFSWQRNVHPQAELLRHGAARNQSFNDKHSPLRSDWETALQTAFVHCTLCEQLHVTGSYFVQYSEVEGMYLSVLSLVHGRHNQPMTVIYFI